MERGVAPGAREDRIPSGTTPRRTISATWSTWCATSDADVIERVRYAAAGGPNQVVSASARPGWVGSPTQATYPSGRISTAVGAGTVPIAGSSHAPSYVGVDRLNAIRPRRDVDAARLPKLSSTGRASCSRRVDPQRAVGGDEVEIGHAASEQRVSRRRGRSECPGRTSSRRIACAARPCSSSSDTMSRSASMRSSGRVQRDLRHRVAQHARGDRVALGVVRVEQALRRGPLDHLRQLPSEIHRVLHADVEALSADRGMHVRRVAGEQDASRRDRSRPGGSCR